MSLKDGSVESYFLLLEIEFSNRQLLHFCHSVSNSNRWSSVYIAILLKHTQELCNWKKKVDKKAVYHCETVALERQLVGGIETQKIGRNNGFWFQSDNYLRQKHFMLSTSIPLLGNAYLYFIFWPIWALYKIPRTISLMKRYRYVSAIDFRYNCRTSNICTYFGGN